VKNFAVDFRGSTLIKKRRKSCRDEAFGAGISDGFVGEEKI